MIKRKTTKYRKGEIIDIEEYHDGQYGAPGKRRLKKAKSTEEQMQKVNAQNKAKRCRKRLLEYFNTGTFWQTPNIRSMEPAQRYEGRAEGFSRCDADREKRV